MSSGADIIAAADHLLVVCATAGLYVIGGSLAVAAAWGWLTKGKGW